MKNISHKLDAWLDKKNPWLTVKNRDKNETNKRFIRVRANDYLRLLGKEGKRKRRVASPYQAKRLESSGLKTSTVSVRTDRRVPI
jgi:hypothetical protein